MSMIDSAQIERLSRYLDATTYRGQVIASNIANVDTPGYHSKDVDFGSQLRAVLTAGDAYNASGMSTASELTGNAAATTTTPLQTAEVKGLSERPDGNNVNIDREGMALGQIQLQFQAATSLLKSELHTISQAIHEGAAQ